MNSAPSDRDLVPPDAVASWRWQSAPHCVVTSSVLHLEVAKRMADRLKSLRRPPETVLDWQPSLGGALAQDACRQAGLSVTSRIHEPTVQRFDAFKRSMPRPWWRLINGCVPVQQGEQFDVVWSNLGLHLASQPDHWLNAWRQSLNPNGFIVFSCLGPDTLQELRLLHSNQGWPSACQDWMDMHDWGDVLLKRGWKDPVMDVERLTLTYRSAESVLADLRAWGRNLHPMRFGSCRSKNWLRRLKAALTEAIQSSPDQCFHLTFEVIHGHAMRPDPRAETSGVKTIPLSVIQGQLKSQRR